MTWFPKPNFATTMNTHYKIRAANDADKMQIHDLIRKNIAGEKKILDPATVNVGFMEEFVDKVIRKGNMLVVENQKHELELIGEVHDYNTSSNTDGKDNLREFRFFSRTDIQSDKHETALINWLFDEIRAKHKDVFRVELSTTVGSQSSVEELKRMGFSVKGNFAGRLKIKPVSDRMTIPLVWTNLAVN